MCSWFAGDRAVHPGWPYGAKRMDTTRKMDWISNEQLEMIREASYPLLDSKREVSTKTYYRVRVFPVRFSDSFAVTQSLYSCGLSAL